jgi:hypothetical protein
MNKNVKTVLYMECRYALSIWVCKYMLSYGYVVSLYKMAGMCCQ